jgi:hypothetical protein
LLSLPRVQLLLGIRAGVDLALKDAVVFRIGGTPCRAPALQPQVVRDAEDPAAKIMARASELKVLEKGQKYFLRHFLGIVIAHAH